mmetsp:Transcript_35449/g.92299  ORF Transcript_35449/g.92299 Transcript_35449/m.92299 type:complete len:89 (+) Transcript_35449:224-490(+)
MRPTSSTSMSGGESLPPSALPPPLSARGSARGRGPDLTFGASPMRSTAMAYSHSQREMDVSRGMYGKESPLKPRRVSSAVPSRGDLER